MPAFDDRTGIWKSGRGKGRNRPKGRQYDSDALDRVRDLLGERPRRRDLLIEFLHLIQDRHGHLSSAHMRALAEEMRLSEAEVFEVASFYAHFDVVRDGEAAPPKVTVRVCDSLSCEMAGAAVLQSTLQAELDLTKVRIIRAPCMGRCDTAPVAEINHFHVDHATPAMVASAIANGDLQPVIPEYQTFDAYCATDGYRALAAIRNGTRSSAEMLRIIEKSGLRGLGGAGFPAYRKFEMVRDAESPKYLAINGDEGEPGTFKDRYYLERTPHLLLEGILLIAHGIGANRCYLYMRDEYPAVLEILRREIDVIENAGLCDRGYIELRRGAGAYICGEESAMIESIEGKRGIPRHRPPYVAEVGIFGRPTLVHNVETLCWITRICREGPDCYGAFGKNGRKGLRAYSISGRVNNPGVHLLDAGSTITDLIAAAGGMLPGHTFKAYQPGGPSSGLLPASLSDAPLDFDTLQPLGSFIGSAAVVILSNHDSARAAAINMLRFFEGES